MRVVLDPNILISNLLSPSGSPARLLVGWAGGEFERIVSPLLLEELQRVLGYPKLRARVEGATAAAVIEWLRRSAVVIPDPDEAPVVRSVDPGDDYLIALAMWGRAVLVSGDDHLLRRSPEGPIRSAAEFLGTLPAGH